MSDNPNNKRQAPRSASARWGRFALVFILLAGLTGGLGYFQFVFKPAMIKSLITSAPAPLVTVAVAEAKSESWVTSVQAIGTFRAELGIDITPQIGGVINAVRFESGQDVQKGAVLIQIDDSVEQADLNANLATLNNAELSLTRQKQLIVGGNTPRATLEAAQAQRDSAAAAVERSRALIAQKVLVAPFAGRLGLRKVDLGQYVAPGTAIVTLQQLDPIFIDFPVPQQALADLEPNQELQVTVDVWPGRVFRGKIAAIDARVNPDTRSVMIRAEVENTDKRLRPGMYAGIDVLVGKPKPVVTLPRTSVTFSLYGDTVFVVKPVPAQSGSPQTPSPSGNTQMMVERRVVKTGETRGDRVVIVSGVEPGEQVVSEGQLKLTADARVRVDNSLALPQAPNPRPKQ